jgi:hypothetical protein
MDFWNQMGIGMRALAIVWVVIIGLWFLKVSAIGTARAVDRMLRPVELRLLQWLQDRSMARALGVPVEIVKVRRRIESADKPINVPTVDGAKTHC